MTNGQSVVPAKAGIQALQDFLDPRFRGGDGMNDDFDDLATR
jgi:hypothetical protein